MKMKKVVSFLTALVLMAVMIVPSFAYASQDTTNTSTNTNETKSVETTYFDDGSYMVVEVKEKKDAAVPFANAVIGEKSAKFYSSNNVLQWRITLYAKFNYDGKSATCLYAWSGYEIVNNSWKFSDFKEEHSGNKATGYFTLKRYTLGIPVQTEKPLLKLSCSANGVVS